MRVLINWFGNVIRGNSLFLSLILKQIFALALFLSLLHLNFINKTCPCNKSLHYCVYVFFFLVFIYNILAPLSFSPCLICSSQHYGVISVPVIQSEGQQKSPGAWNRLLSQAENTDTFSAGITLFHYWQSSFSPLLSLNHLCLSSFYFSLPLSFCHLSSPSSTLSFYRNTPTFWKMCSFHALAKVGKGQY